MASTDRTRRPFRFGVQLSGGLSAHPSPAGVPGDRSWIDLARLVEDLGYDTITMPDHFTPQFAPVPALMAAAAATERVRVSALVFDNDYKHPVVLAKELATMDVLSGGRVDIGIGAGWMRSDYDAAGIQYDRPGVRIARFAEAVAVIKGVMGVGPFSFSGEHYTITNYDGFPKPVQLPHPPILIGGGGKRVLTIAAREADIVGINGSLPTGEIGPEALGTMTLDAVTERVGWVREAAGERINDIELNIRAFFVAVTPSNGNGARASVIASVAKMLSVDDAMVEASPFALIGSVSSITEDLLRRREELGFSYVIVGPDEIESFAPVVSALAGT